MQKTDMDKEKDIFSEIIRDKLSNYSTPVDDNSWDKIEEGLNSVNSGKAKRLWIATFAVAASIALLFLLFPFNKKVYNHETANQLSDHEETIIQDVPEKEIIQSDLQQVVKHPAVFGKSQSGKQLAKNELTAEIVIKEEIKEENPEKESAVPVIEEPVVEENTSTKHVVNPVSDFDFGKEVIIPVISNNKRKGVSLSFGSGRNLLAKNNMVTPQIPKRVLPEDPLISEETFYKASNQEIIQPQTENILATEDYPDVVHYPPVSVSLTARKDITRTIAIESGIVYSYITSTFSKESSYKSKADLQLHYIGIPLNIHTRLYGDRKSQWGLYLSTGGMVEKGLLSHLALKTFLDDNNTVMTVVSNEKIKGLQWSVSVSPGIDYQIYKNYSIYFEPKLSYYFDNNQPESARTEHPVTVGANAGLRYTW